MSPKNIIRAWKDEEYRLSLSEADQALLPAHPAGSIELADAELGAAVGGNWDYFFGLGLLNIFGLSNVDGGTPPDGGTDCTKSCCTSCNKGNGHCFLAEGLTTEVSM